MGLFKGIKKGLSSVLGAVGDIFGFILDPLLPDLPKTPKSIEARGKTNNVDLRFNDTDLGDVKSVVYGKCRVWPNYVSAPWRAYISHDEVMYAYLHITVGYADILDIRIGDTPITTFPGIEVEVLQPGEDMTLFYPNVYTNPEVEGLELMGGAITDIDGSPATLPNGKIVAKFYESGTTTIDVGTFTFTSDTPGAFEDFREGDLIYVYDAGGNSGQYTITGISNEDQTIQTFPAPSSSTTQSAIGFFTQRRFVGPYPMNPPGTAISHAAVDIVFAALQDEDKPDSIRTVEFLFQYRPIDDAGNVLDPTWTDVTFSFSDKIAKARRYTYEFDIGSPAGRFEGRLWRETYEQNDSEDPSSAAQWVRLKGYIDAMDVDDPTGDAFCTRVAVKVTSSGELTGQSSRQVNLLVQRLLRVYESGGWSAPVVSRNPVWAAADWLTSQSNGTVGDADLDTDAFITLANFCDTNEDTFDAEFDKEVAYWEGAQTILRICRARPVYAPYERYITVYRDEPADPVWMYCDGFNIDFGDDSIAMPDADTVTGVQVTFTDPLLWIVREGPLIGSDDDIRKVPFMGCTTWQKAWEEGQYEYRDLYYRTQTVSGETEMDGLLPVNSNRVLLSSNLKGWGQSGEVTFRDNLTITVDPPPVWTSGLQHYVYLQDGDGIPVGPIDVTQGAGPEELVLDSDPGITMRLGASWRTLYAFGHDGDEAEGIAPNAPRIAILQERKSKGQRTASLNFLFDNAFVHADPGPAPDDPYALGGEIPDLTITGLVAEQQIFGAILDETGPSIDDETDDPLLDEAFSSTSVVAAVSWDPVVGVTLYQVYARYTGDPFVLVYSGLETSTQISAPTNGTLHIRVRAYSGPYVGADGITSVVIDAN